MVFEVIKGTDNTGARLGLFHTAHGVVETPAFFPVATQATVKGISPKELMEIKIVGLLVNAYHLYLRPGVEVIKRAGGLHRFMGFYGPIITDSGGYQVFSLSKLCNINDEGVTFHSHVDGAKKFLSPQEVVKIQVAFGSDVILPLDECVRLPASKEYIAQAVERTVKWARISREVFDELSPEGSLFFGIIQGGTFKDLRQECMEELVEIGIDGAAIGGLSVGENEEERYDIISYIAEKLPSSYIRYFMGYGRPVDILEAVSRGIDLFDCVVPTRFGRTGTAFTGEGKIVVRNSIYATDYSPLDRECRCYVCQEFSRAYLRHLINVNEMLGVQLITYHNLYWYLRFMERVRDAIRDDNFDKFKREFLERFKEESV